MFYFNSELYFLYAVFLFSLLSIFLTAWVVWHAERKLDVAYKFFLAAILSFGMGILFEIFQFYNVVASWHWEKIFKSLFVIFFTAGVFEMRELIINLGKASQADKGIMPSVKSAAKKITRNKSDQTLKK